MLVFAVTLVGYAARPSSGTASAMCCECTKGSDMGSDLVSFSAASAAGASCETCCEAAGTQYHAGRLLSESTCDAHAAPLFHGSCTAAAAPGQSLASRLSAAAAAADRRAPSAITYEVSVPAEINVSSAGRIGGWVPKDFSATWSSSVRGARKVVAVSFADADGDAYVTLSDTSARRRDGSHPSCTLDLGNNWDDLTPMVTTMVQAGLACSAGTPSDGSDGSVVVETVAPYAGHAADCVWKGAACLPAEPAATANATTTRASDDSTGTPKCACHGPTWVEIDDGASGRGGHCYDELCIENEEARWQHPLSDCAARGAQKPFCASSPPPPPPNATAWCCATCTAGGCSAKYAPGDEHIPTDAGMCVKGGRITPIPNHGENCGTPAYCCSCCSAGGCSAWYDDVDEHLGADCGCTKGGYISPIPNHGQECKAHA